MACTWDPSRAHPKVQSSQPSRRFRDSSQAGGTAWNLGSVFPWDLVPFRPVCQAKESRAFCWPTKFPIVKIHQPFKGRGDPAEKQIQLPLGIPDPSIQVRLPPHSPEAVRPSPPHPPWTWLGQEKWNWGEGSFWASAGAAFFYTRASHSSFLGDPYGWVGEPRPSC